MKLPCYSETDSLYMEFASGPGTGTREIALGINLDLGGDGRAVGRDIDAASRTLDLPVLETVALPLTSLRAA